MESTTKPPEPKIRFTPADLALARRLEELMRNIGVGSRFIARKR